jgi:hypothetical protein
VRSADYLTPLQEKMMAQDPAMIRLFARHLAADLERRGQPGAQIYAMAYASLNGRPSQLLIDPNVDLAATRAGRWILPLNR